MEQMNLESDAFISASTIFSVDEEMINVNTDSENKNSFAYACPELFY